MPTLLRAWAIAFVGVLLLQAVWLLVIPPFQGMDEHDHVFKAKAVAHGDWSGTHPQVEVGRGELVAVPRDIAEAARPACEALHYTLRDDCSPSSDLADGRVLIGSAAARYHPFYYAVIGTASRSFGGIAAGHAMRVTTAVWCAALIALAIVVVRRTARTCWPTAAILAALTPTMLYSSSLVAPNGPEMAAGLLLWCALTFGASVGTPAPRWVVIAGTVAAVHLAVLRSMGPLWLALILGTAALSIGVPAFLRAAPSRRLRIPLLVVGTALAVGVAWTITSGTNNPSGEPSPGLSESHWPRMFSNWLVWVLQQIAAVPSRDYPAPTIVYAIALALWSILLVLALRAAQTRTRLAITAIFAVASAIWIAITALTYARLGYAWQGRYSWPYVIGWLVLSGWALDRSSRPTPGAYPVALLTGLAAAVTVVLTAFRIPDSFAAKSPYFGDGWWQPPPILVGVLAAAGMILLLVSLLPTRPAARPSPTPDGEDREAGRQALIG